MAAHILVIEDNQTNLELMTYLLQAHGYPLSTAMDGLAAIETAVRESPDLIVCDVQLPKVDGFEVVRTLKARREFQRIPLVAVTALAMVGDRERLINAGFAGYVAKPIDPETFVRDIEAFLPPALRAPPRTAQVWAEEPLPVQPQTVRGTVLVVDDVDANRMLLRSILEPHGYSVTTAHSLAQARAALLAEPPGLILSDVHLRDGSAIDFVNELRRDRTLGGIPVLLQSASAPDLEYQTIRQLNLKLLGRPLEPAEILAEVEAAFKNGTAPS